MCRRLKSLYGQYLLRYLDARRGAHVLLTLNVGTRVAAPLNMLNFQHIFIIVLPSIGASILHYMVNML